MSREPESATRSRRHKRKGSRRLPRAIGATGRQLGRTGGHSARSRGGVAATGQGAGGAGTSRGAAARGHCRPHRSRSAWFERRDASFVSAGNRRFPACSQNAVRSDDITGRSPASGQNPQDSGNITREHRSLERQRVASSEATESPRAVRAGGEAVTPPRTGWLRRPAAREQTSSAPGAFSRFLFSPVPRSSTTFRPATLRFGSRRRLPAGSSRGRSARPRRRAALPRRRRPSPSRGKPSRPGRSSSRPSGTAAPLRNR